jgi:hypothetical protein
MPLLRLFIGTVKNKRLSPLVPLGLIYIKNCDFVGKKTAYSCGNIGKTPYLCLLFRVGK